MGTRALDFSRAHPDASPGYAAAVTRLEALLARADQVAGQQREGQLEVRAATARKKELKRSMQQAHLSHLAQVAKVAAREVPELAQKLVLRPRTRTYLAFRTAARGMAAEAQSQKEVLVKHGLVETVLDNLVQALDQFDAAVESGAEGRRAHVGASAELTAVADEVFQIVERDGRPQPLPLHERRGAAGGVGERQQRAGGAAGGRETRARAGRRPAVRCGLRHDEEPVLPQGGHVNRRR